MWANIPMEWGGMVRQFSKVPVTVVDQNWNDYPQHRQGKEVHF